MRGREFRTVHTTTVYTHTHTSIKTRQAYICIEYRLLEYQHSAILNFFFFNILQRHFIQVIIIFKEIIKITNINVSTDELFSFSFFSSYVLIDLREYFIKIEWYNPGKVWLKPWSSAWLQWQQQVYQYSSAIGHFSLIWSVVASRYLIAKF